MDLKQANHTGANDGKTTSRMGVYNPATGVEIYQIEPADQTQIDAVFENAKNAATDIAAMTVAHRIENVLKLNDWILAHTEEILDAIIAETGKSRLDALASEVFEVCDVIDYYKKNSGRILGEKKVHTPIFLMGKKSHIVPEPLGVILVIAPWNYPFYQGIVPGILSFLAGNACIFKPSEVTPLKGLWERMLTESGFAQHAFQVVYGGRQTGAQLIEKRPDKIHFTGSVRAGKQIMAAAAPMLIPVDLELGGKDPSIVFEDVNLERTVNGVMWGAFTTAGQSCTSLERLYVQQSIFDSFVDLLVDRCTKLRTAEGSENAFDCDMGTVTPSYQVSKIEKQLDQAVAMGATIRCGGQKQKGSHHMPPTVVTGVTHKMQLGSEETFGPVVAVMPFTDEADAIRQANDSVYGLGASVWTRDLKRGKRVARALRCGNVSINNHMITEANPALPFGGVGDSGFGRYKGDEGLTTFGYSKSILVDKQSGMIEPHWYPFTKSKYQLMRNLMDSYFGRRKKWLKFAINGLKIDSIGKKEKLK